MIERERKRNELIVVDDAGDGDVSADEAPYAPMRISEINEISKMFGESKPVDADKYGLQMWPKFDVTRHSPGVWRRCIQLSPQVKSRFDITNRDELKKFFNVGLLLEEDMENLTSSQALVLG